MNAAPHKPKNPIKLPKVDISTFTGRQTELEKLYHLLISNHENKISSIVGLAGSGGIGKSALAFHFATIYQDAFPDGVIGVRVDGKEPTAIVNEFLRNIGKELDPEEEEHNLSAIMQEEFGPKQALLIFDNADHEQIGALLPGGNRCAVIITTRDRGLPTILNVALESQLDITPLPNNDAVQLLGKLIGHERVNRELDTIQQIISLVGGLPLALQIVGAALYLRPRRSLQAYAEVLREERDRLARLKIRGSDHLDIRASFAVSLELLEPHETAFFASLGVCAEDGFSLQTACAAGNSTEWHGQEMLDYLYRMSLLNLADQEEERYVFHPLIRLIAREIAKDRNLLSDASARTANYWLQFVKDRGAEHSQTITIINNMGDVLNAAEWLLEEKIEDDDFLIRLEPILLQGGYWLEASNLMTGFLTLAEESENWQAVVHLRIQMAKFLVLIGRFEDAISALEPCEKIFPMLHPIHLQNRSIAMWSHTYGGVLQRQGNFDAAVEAFQRSLDISEELNDEFSISMVLNSLGGVLQRQGNFDAAVDAIQRSLDLKIKLNDEHGISMGLNSLGGVLQRQGNFDGAVKAFQRSLDIKRKLNDERGIAMGLNSLGSVLQRQGNFNAAVDAFQRSLDIKSKLNDERGIAIGLNSLGWRPPAPGQL